MCFNGQTLLSYGYSWGSPLNWPSLGLYGTAISLFFLVDLVREHQCWIVVVNNWILIDDFSIKINPVLPRMLRENNFSSLALIWRKKTHTHISSKHFYPMTSTPSKPDLRRNIPCKSIGLKKKKNPLGLHFHHKEVISSPGLDNISDRNLRYCEERLVGVLRPRSRGPLILGQSPSCSDTLRSSTFPGRVAPKHLTTSDLWLSPPSGWSQWRRY